MRHAVVVDLGWGDTGKGSLADYLCETRGYRTVIRYNGGAQAGHRVVREDGREHVFHQFGSGTFTGAATVLSRFMLVNPLAIAKEADELEARGVDRPLSLLYVDPDALVTTPIHASVNRIEETQRGAARHGSCGHGIGKTREYALTHPEDALYVNDLAWPGITEGKLELLAERFGQPVRRNGMRELAASYKRFTQSVEVLKRGQAEQVFVKGEPCVFEGAQGVLLDESWGFPPYNTWTNTTPANALTLLEEAGVPRSQTTVYGLTRSYATRHGPGPFPTEDSAMTRDLFDAANGFNAWQREWRVGHLDVPTLLYALRACKNEVDELVVSCLDRVSDDTACVYYETGSRIPQADVRFLENAIPMYASSQPVLDVIADSVELPITITSHGPTAADKKEHVLWSSWSS